MLSRPLHTLGAALGLVLLLGCSGVFGEAEDEDGVAEAPTGETGDTGEGEEDDEEAVDSAAADTGRKERKPRDGKRKKRGEKDRDKRGGGRGDKPAPKPKPSGKGMCFGGKGLDLQISVDGNKVSGSLEYSGKAEIEATKLSGTRDGNRVSLSGMGTVNGKKKPVKVQAGKAGGGAVVKIDGKAVKGAKVVACP